jgi:2,5-furandicarboxylate decarboxylase 1
MVDLRTFLQLLHKKCPEEIVTIHDPVEPDYEITAIARELEKRNTPVVLFPKVKGHSFPIVTNLLGSRKRIALAIGATPEDFNKVWNVRMEKLIRPRTVSSGAVKDIVLTGNRVDVIRLPVHRHFEQDGGKYISNALMVVKDPETGIRNLSFSRTQLIDERTLRNSMHSRGHQWMIYGKSERMNRHLEVAIVIGMHPALLLAAATRFLPLGLDEYDVAGALLREPVDLIPCETVHLEVPANAEIVIEGEILAHVRDDEGPFGEYTGYASKRSTRNVIRVKAITHREDAYYQDLMVGNSSEHLLLMGIPKQAVVLQRMQQVLPNVKQINWPISGVTYVSFIQLAEPVDDGQPNLAGTLLLGLDSYVKMVVVVNEDIDVFDEKEVLWAISTRVNPSLDINLLKNMFCNRLDPSATDSGTVGKMIIDATKKKGGQFTRLTLPEEIVNRAKRTVQELLTQPGDGPKETHETRDL